MRSSFARTIVLAALFLPLAACGNSPQQPSDTVDDQGLEASLEGSPELRNIENVGTDPTATGSVTSPPATLESVVGRWAANAASCETPGPEVTITTARFASIERTCEIADAIDGGNGKLTLGLRCTGTGGDVDSELVKLSPTDAGLDLTVVGGDAGPQSLVRCT